MGSRHAGFVFYPDKWLSATEHLSDAAYRAYHRILCWMWIMDDEQSRILNDPAAITIACGKRGSKLSRVLDEIQNPACALLREEGNYLVSNGLRKEYQAAEARRGARARAANARWSQCKRNANASPVHPLCSGNKTLDINERSVTVDVGLEGASSGGPAPSSATRPNGTQRRTGPIDLDALVRQQQAAHPGESLATAVANVVASAANATQRADDGAGPPEEVDGEGMSPERVTAWVERIEEITGDTHSTANWRCLVEAMTRTQAGRHALMAECRGLQSRINHRNPPDHAGRFLNAALRKHCARLRIEVSHANRS